ILRLRAELKPIEQHARRPDRIGERSAQSSELGAVEQVDVRIRRAEQRRIYREEKAQSLDLKVVDVALVPLLGARGEGELARLRDVSRLLGEYRSHAQRAELVGDLQAVVAARQRRRDEARGGRREVD